MSRTLFHPYLASAKSRRGRAGVYKPGGELFGYSQTAYVGDRHRLPQLYGDDQELLKAFRRVQRSIGSLLQQGTPNPERPDDVHANGSLDAQFYTREEAMNSVAQTTDPFEDATRPRFGVFAQSLYPTSDVLETGYLPPQDFYSEDGTRGGWVRSHAVDEYVRHFVAPHMDREEDLYQGHSSTDVPPLKDILRDRMTDPDTVFQRNMTFGPRRIWSEEKQERSLAEPPIRFPAPTGFLGAAGAVTEQ